MKKQIYAVVFIIQALVWVVIAGETIMAFPSPVQDLDVYFHEEYVVRGQIDREILFSSADASDAIQFAIDAVADEGGEVCLQRGNYPLSTPLYMRDGVVLRGKARGSRLVVRTDNPSGTGIILEDLKGVQVADLSVKPEADGEGVSGILIDNSGDCQIRNVHCQGFGSHGIKLMNNSFLCEISGCQLVDNRKSNLYLENLREGGRGGDFLPNMISDLTIYGGGNGIECKYAIVVNITGCQIFQTKGHGIYLHSVSNSVLVTGCRTFQIETDAIVVEDSHEINISGNIFCWHRGHGLVLKNVTWGTISANNIIDSGVRASDGVERNGIVISEETRSIQVTGNAIFNWGDQVPMMYGILEGEKCSLNTIAYNNINFFTRDAVLSGGKGTVIKDNQARGPDAWIGMEREPWPDFKRDPIESFIDH